MGRTLDLGRRLELVSMDPLCHDIAIALYQQQPGGVSEYLIHSYSSHEGVRERLEFLTRALEVLAGLEAGQAGLRFPCGAPHQAAIRRGFLEACKLETGAALQPRPLMARDKKLERTVTVTSLGAGLYGVSVEGPQESSAARVDLITGGFKKLAELEFIAGEPHRVVFPCGRPHDALMGLLLPRALNARAALREEEMAASRGMLVAPSAQK